MFHVCTGSSTALYLTMAGTMSGVIHWQRVYDSIQDNDLQMAPKA